MNILEGVLPGSGQASSWGPEPSSATSFLDALDEFPPLSGTQFPYLEEEALVRCPWRSHPCQSSLGYWPGCGGLPPGGQRSGAAFSLLGAAEFGAWDELSAWLEVEAISWSEGLLGILLDAWVGAGGAGCRGRTLHVSAKDLGCPLTPICNQKARLIVAS